MSEEYGNNRNRNGEDEKAELLDLIAAQIEQRARLESVLGADPDLPDLPDLRRGLEILQRELALHQTRTLN
jgi:hypothetical protein